MRKYMDEKKRGNTHQSNGITQEPTYRGRFIFAPVNAVICQQACGPKDGCPGGRSRTYKNIADHVPAATQPEIDLKSTAQHIRCRAITDGNSRSSDCVAEGYRWLSVN